MSLVANSFINLGPLAQGDLVRGPNVLVDTSPNAQRSLFRGNTECLGAAPADYIQSVTVVNPTHLNVQFYQYATQHPAYFVPGKWTITSGLNTYTVTLVTKVDNFTVQLTVTPFMPPGSYALSVIPF